VVVKFSFDIAGISHLRVVSRPTTAQLCRAIHQAISQFSPFLNGALEQRQVCFLVESLLHQTPIAIARQIHLTICM